jgi:exosortase C (VPDSG-CTERM-specific)
MHNQPVNLGAAVPDSPAAPARLSPRRWIGLLLSTALLVLLFIRPLSSLVALALKSDVLSYILLVPFVSAYIIYVRKGRLPREYDFSVRPAAVALGVGSLALAMPWLLRALGVPVGTSESLAITILSFVSYLVGVGFAFLGHRWMAAFAFPVAFLFLLIPLPNGVIDGLETASKLASTEMADLLFDVTNTPALRDGNVFQLPGMIVEVAQECSGIRSSLVLLLTSMIAANLFLKSPWRRAVLVAAVIPLAILRNGFRIMVIGMLCVNWGPHMIDSAIHHHGGPLFFGLSLVPLFLLLWWLRRGEARGHEGASEPAKATP